MKRQRACVLMRVTERSRDAFAELQDRCLTYKDHVETRDKLAAQMAQELGEEPEKPRPEIQKMSALEVVDRVAMRLRVEPAAIISEEPQFLIAINERELRLLEEIRERRSADPFNPLTFNEIIALLAQSELRKTALEPSCT